MKHQTLRDVLPKEFFTEDMATKRIERHLNQVVVREIRHIDRDSAWPGPHRNVIYWWELENGYAVGWNENPSRGWSFPVIKLKSEIATLGPISDAIKQFRGPHD